MKRRKRTAAPPRGREPVYRSEEERKTENRRWRRAAAAVGLFIAAMIGAGMAGARLVTELRD